MPNQTDSSVLLYLFPHLWVGQGSNLVHPNHDLLLLLILQARKARDMRGLSELMISLKRSHYTSAVKPSAFRLLNQPGLQRREINGIELHFGGN